MLPGGVRLRCTRHLVASCLLLLLLENYSSGLKVVILLHVVLAASLKEQLGDLGVGHRARFLVMPTSSLMSPRLTHR